jgi:hypothetical protein
MDCSICLEKVPNKGYFETSCHHKYHKKCIEPWLKEQNTCPTCRAFQPSTTINIPPPPNIVINIRNLEVQTDNQYAHRKRVCLGSVLFCFYFLFSMYNAVIVSLVKSVNESAQLSENLLTILYILLCVTMIHYLVVYKISGFMILVGIGLHTTILVFYVIYCVNMYKYFDTLPLYLQINLPISFACHILTEIICFSIFVKKIYKSCD